MYLCSFTQNESYSSLECKIIKIITSKANVFFWLWAFHRRILHRHHPPFTLLTFLNLPHPYRPHQPQHQSRQLLKSSPPSIALSLQRSASSPISIDAYLERIFSYSKCEESSLVSSLIYLDRISSDGNVLLTPYNIHRILFTSVLVAIKYNEDRIYKMKYYASIAGVSEKELRILESVFLSLVRFNLYINEKEYEEYSNCLLIQDKS